MPYSSPSSLGAPWSVWVLIGVIGWASAGQVSGQTAADPAAVRPATDVFLQELDRQARGNHQQLARSIGSGLQLRLHAAASRYLESLAGRDLSDAEASEVVQVIGGERLLEASLNDAISEPAKAEIQKLFEGKRRHDRSPERLEEAIGRLAAADPDRQPSAIRTLLSAGIDAIAPLAVAAAKESQPSVRDRLLGVLVQLGPDSLTAMSTLAMYGSDPLRASALPALHRMKPDAARPLLAVAAVSSRAADPQRQFAHTTLERQLGSLPTQHEVEDYLVDRLASLRERFQRQINLIDPQPLWNYSADTGLLSYQLTAAGLYQQRQLADTARLMAQLDSLSERGWRAAVQADLSYRYLADPLRFASAQERSELISDLQSLWGARILQPQSLADLIATALRDNDYPALAASLALTDSHLQGSAAPLLKSHSDSVSPLVRAVDHPVPQVRYEAALAVARLLQADPSIIRGGFSGISRVGHRFDEILRLHRQPTALLVDTRPARQAHLERLFAAVGFRVEVVSSVVAAEDRLASGGDIQCVVANSVLPDRTVLELVDRIRRIPLGQYVPILIHGPLDDSIQAAVDDVRWDLQPVYFELPQTIAGLGATLEPQRQLLNALLQGIEPLTADQRYSFRRRASDLIQQLAQSPEIYESCGMSQISQRLIAEAAAAGGKPAE